MYKQKFNCLKKSRGTIPLLFLSFYTNSVIIKRRLSKSGGKRMICPACQHNGSKVVDSRPADLNKSIRRRRECESCSFRFTTFEKIEDTPLIVVKKDGSRDEFVGEKILRGLIRACEKRPIELDELKNIVYLIEKELRSSGIGEINSEDVGEMVMERLAEVDEVAYVRFASVYRDYQDVSVFIEELKNLQTRLQKE